MARRTISCCTCSWLETRSACLCSRPATSVLALAIRSSSSVTGISYVWAGMRVCAYVYVRACISAVTAQLASLHTVYLEGDFSNAGRSNAIYTNGVLVQCLGQILEHYFTISLLQVHLHYPRYLCPYTRGFKEKEPRPVLLHTSALSG